MKKGTILIVEDEKDLVRLLTYNFKKEGYTVFSTRTAEGGLESARTHKPDMVILDIMLPKMDGLEMSRLLRKESSVPILFLSAKKSETDRVLGLKIGGDDYLVKPFSVTELLARVEAILRRSAHRPQENGKGKKIGSLAIDFERHEVSVSGKLASLTPKEFDLLKLLVESDGKVLSRDQLLEKVWGHEKGLEISTRTVDQHIARLRRKLATDGKRIVTVTNSGYRLRG